MYHPLTILRCINVLPMRDCETTLPRSSSSKVPRLGAFVIKQRPARKRKRNRPSARSTEFSSETFINPSTIPSPFLPLVVLSRPSQERLPPHIFPIARETPTQTMAYWRMQWKNSGSPFPLLSIHSSAGIRMGAGLMYTLLV